MYKLVGAAQYIDSKANGWMWARIPFIDFSNCFTKFSRRDDGSGDIVVGVVSGRP